MSIIANFLTSVFGKEDFRVIFLGLDAAGRTTALYKLVLGEVVTTIPTIGFNVETVTLNGRTKLTVWDVGGCDKIRPLWKHYYQGLDGIVFFIDANDRDRLLNTDNQWSYGSSEGLLQETFKEEILAGVPLCVFVNKIDCENSQTVQEVGEKLKLHQFEAGGTRSVHICGGSALQGTGLWEALTWLADAIHSRKNNPVVATTAASTVPAPTDASSSTSTMSEEDRKMEERMTEWLERVDEPASVFLKQLQDATLPLWDHYTHLRIAWLLLLRYGRREGMKHIFEGIKSFIERSPITKPRATSAPAATNRGTTFHETMTYFWVHMVDYSMRNTTLKETATVAAASTAGIESGDESNAESPSVLTSGFKRFLLFNPHLCNGGLFLHYYTKKLMLLNAEARTSVLLPDIRPLPSFLSALPPAPPTSESNSTTTEISAAASVVHEDTATGAAATPLHLRLQPRRPLTDQEFLDAFRNQSLPSWGHDCKIRLIYLLLTQSIDEHANPSNNRNAVLHGLQEIEKSNFHVTESYFWLQMVSYHIALLKKENNENPTVTTAAGLLGTEPANTLEFDEFYRRPVCQSLRNSLLVDKYYSPKVIDSPQAIAEFVLPDLKPLPSVVKR